MVKDQKLWREIQLQYAKLREDEVGADLFPSGCRWGSAGDLCISLTQLEDMGGFPKIEVPLNNPFGGTPIYGNHHMTNKHGYMSKPTCE